jgi:hypothetical protein
MKSPFFSSSSSSSSFFFIGQTKTSFSGRFMIEFSRNDASLNNDDEFPVDLRFAKNTSTISHRFLCNEETRDCTARLINNGMVVGNETNMMTTYLQHLEFNSCFGH